MDERPRLLGPALAALATLAVFGVLSYLGWQYIQDTILIARFSGGAPPLSEDPLTFLAQLVLVAGFAVSALAALAVYLALATGARAARLAERRSRRLLRSREWFERLYEYSPTPYLLVSPDGRIRQPNKAALRLFGVSRRELEGARLFDAIAEGEEGQAEMLAERFSRGISINGAEVRIRRADGSVRWVLLSIYGVGESGRAPLSGLTSLFDITERKEVDRAKSEFVSLASHQLLTPLSAIKWYTGMLQQTADNLTEKQRHYLERTFEGNERMIGLVNMLLNVSRIEMGTLAIEPQDVSITELCDSVLAELEPKARERELAVERTYAEALPALHTDPQLLRIVLQNLLSNAIKYTPAGGVVRAALSREGSEMRIAVADTGYGIPPAQQDKIFTKMFRADNVREKEVEGTGLGLYITKSIVEMMGGDISFTSELDAGTTFTVSLPLHAPIRAREGKRLSRQGIS